MKARKASAVRILRINKQDNRQTIYAKAKRAFTAADLQRVTEVGDTYPVEGLIEELEGIHAEEKSKLKARHRKKPS